MTALSISERIPFDLPLVAIGNSQGLRLPKPLLRSYGFQKHVVVEQRPEGLLLKPASHTSMLSLEESFMAMAKASKAGDSQEDFSEWDATSSDGLNHVPW